MKIPRLAVFALLILSLIFPAAAEISTERREEADAFFDALFQKSHAVGGLVLVSQEGERLYGYTHGWGDKAKTRPVTEDTVFKVASVTKLVTAIGVMQLVEQEKLSLDAPLTDLSAAAVRNPRYPQTPVTLRQVMSHTSSISSEAPYSRKPRWAHIDDDSSYFCAWQPGTRYEYANLNGGFLGSLIERASGQSLNTYMAENVFSPLGVNAAYAATLLPDAAPLSNTFSPDGSTYRTAAAYLKDGLEYEDTCDPDRHYRSSVGSLYISAVGLEKLGMALAGDGSVDGVRLLAPETVRLMREDQRIIPGSTVTGESPYGLCLYRHTMDWDVWYGHQGRWEGMLADVFFEPATRTVVVFIANGVKREPGREVASLAESALEFIAPWTYYIVSPEDE